MQTDKNVLAIDLGTQAGWAVWANGVITSGSVSLHRYKGCKSRPADHAGKTYLNFYAWLNEKVITDRIEEIAFEEPMGHMKNAAATNILHGLRGILMFIAAKFNVPVTGYPQPKIKKNATGKGNSKKPEMVAWAEKRFAPIGHKIDENEADALAVLNIHLSL